MKTWADLDKFQRSVGKLIFEAGEPGEAKLDVITQNGAFLGVSTTMKAAEQISLSSPNRPIVFRACAKSGLYSALGECGGNGYGERIKNLFEDRCKWKDGDASRCAVVLLIDHAGEMHPDRWAQIFRCADEAAYKLQIAVHVVVNLDWQHRKDRKGNTVASIPPRNCSMYPRQRTWEAGRNGDKKYFTLLKPSHLFDACDEEMPLIDSAGQQQQKTA